MENLYSFIIYITVFIIGICIGSFLNVCIYRIPRGESIVYPPSHCTNCGSKIKWYDLIPIISYFIIGGKCRGCKENISIIYPLIEFTTGIIFVFIFYKFEFSYEFFKYAILVCNLIVIGIIDFKTTDIYLKTTMFGLIVGFAFAIYSYYFNGEFIVYILGAIVGFGIIALIILITKGMGWGDAEICLVCGIFLGFKQTILMLFISFIIGAITGVTLILIGKKTKKDYIPFGPSIALAAIITVFLGNNIINWYLS